MDWPHSGDKLYWVNKMSEFNFNIFSDFFFNILDNVFQIKFI